MPDFDTSGVTEIPPSPSNVTTVSEPAAAPAPVPIQPSPEEKAAYESQFGPPPLNPIRDLSAQELADLSVQDKDHFDLVSAFRSQPDLHADPAIVQKTADALNLVKQRGFKLSDLPSVGQAVKGIATSAKGFGKQLWNYTNVAADVLGAAVTSPFSTDVAETFAKDVDTRLSQNIAGTEEGMAGIADIGRKATGKLARATGIAKDFSQYTPQEKQNDLWAEVGRHEVQQARLEGKGPFTAAVTGGVAGEQHLNPEETATLAAGDPFSFYTFGKGMQAAGGLVPQTVKAAAAGTLAKAGTKLAEVAPKVGGGAVEAVGKAMEVGGNFVQPIGKVASVAGPIVGGLAKLAGADTLGSVGGGILGGTAGVALRRAGEVAVDWSRAVKDVGRQIAGSTPIKSAYTQAGRDFLQALPGAAGEAAKGAAVDLGLAAASSETPQETQGAATFGTALGALHGAGRMAGRLISGQIIGPREYGVNTVTPSSGQFPALDALHTQAVRNSPPGVRVRLNAVRQFLSGTQSGADAFLAPDAASLEKALTDSGVDPQTAKLWSQQQGFFTADLPGRDGQTRPVVVMTNVEAAPHESFHVIQDVLGEAGNREVDKIVRDAYADRWDQEGTTYAQRLAGKDLGGKTWQEVVLDSSGWGLDEVKEKLYLEFANRIRNESGAEPPPGMAETQARAALGQLMDSAVQNNPHLSPNEIAKHVWRDVLSPEEAQAVADRYIARELAAENFDAAFKAKSIGASDNSLPAKLGRIAGNVVSALGGEPLSGRESEFGKVPLKTPVVEAVKNAAKAKGTVTPGPDISPRLTPRGPAPVPQPPGPTTREEEQTRNGEEARRIADEAPATPPPTGKGTKSPRELLGQIAESIAKGEGVKLNYLSAPDEPAAATTSNRDTRRAIIETFRTMPPESRALWEKTFFPDRVVKTKTGYQVLGWAPEVFAANAHKMAGFLADHTALSPYEIDAKTKTFTPAGWQELYSDVQKFVQNQKAGTTGAGEPLVVPKSVSDRGLFAPARRGGEIALDQTKADFINLLFNFKLPETGRTIKGKMPLNIAGQDVSTATQPGRVETPVRPRADFAGDFTGRSVMEVNPLRNQIEAAAKAAKVEVPSLIEAVQRLNLENIKEVEPAPEAPEFRGNTLTLSAGFQPEAVVKEVSEMNPAEFSKWAEAQAGGFTKTAHDIGLAAPSQEFVNDLKAKAEASVNFQRERMAAKDVTAAMGEMFKSQFYREAYEAAEGTGSAGDYFRKKLGDAYKPPFPAKETPTAQFNPSQEPDAIKRAAVRRKDNKEIFTGETHGEAWRNSKAGDGGVDYGFVTNAGDFLNRKEAWKRAKEMGQIEGDEWTPTPGDLESVVFENANVRAKYGFKGQAQPEDKRTPGTGLDFKDFFSKVTKGTFGKSDKPFEPTLDLSDPESEAFIEAKAEHSGNFDDHIAKSIPTFYDAQIRKGAAIAKTFGESFKGGADVLDIAASEGSFGKAISDQTGGVVKTVSLDPNPDMAKFFTTKSQAPGATYSEDAFLNGFEDNGKTYPAYDPKKKFDVVNESMGFQFIDKDRDAQVAEVKRLMKPDGVFLTEEKLKNPAWKANEAKKDLEHKNKYFTPEELKAKDEVVGFSQAKQETKTVGMVDNMATQQELENVLKKHFKHVVQYWDSGNFKGYAASDSVDKLNALVSNMGDLKSDFSTVATPRIVQDAGADDFKFQASQAQFSPSKKKESAVEPEKYSAEWYAALTQRRLEEQKQRDREADLSKYSAEERPAEAAKIFKNIQTQSDKDKSPLQLGVEDALPNSVGGELRLIHFSDSNSLKEIDPAKIGKGLATPTDLRGAPKSFFFVEDSQVPPPDDVLLTKNAYGVRVDGNGIYNLNGDTLGILREPNRELRDETLKDAGYTGFQVHTQDGRDVVSLYHPVDATPLGSGTGKEGHAVSPGGQFQPQAEDQATDLFGGSSKEFIGNRAVADMTREELKNHFPEAIVPSPRDIEIPSEITKAPLYKQAGSEPKAVEAFANKLVEFANDYKDDPSFKAGSEWYSKFAPMLKKAFGKDSQIFAELLAATSPQTAAGVNFSYAYDALRSLREGRFDKIIPKFDEGLDMIAEDRWVPWYNKELKAGRIPKPPANPTPAAFLEAWINKHDLKPRQSNGSLYGTHSIPVLQVFARKWLTESRGPKTLNFVKNLVGDEHEATIDLWADRTMRRVGYSGFKDRWRILPGNGTGVPAEDFAFGQKAFRSAAQKLGMKPDALQGALWFAEKKLWHEKGWGRLDLGDFATEMGKIPMLESGFQQRIKSDKVKTKKEEALDLFDVQPRKFKK